MILCRKENPREIEKFQGNTKLKIHDIVQALIRQAAHAVARIIDAVVHAIARTIDTATIVQAVMNVFVKIPRKLVFWEFSD
jgi:predicted GTPase